MKHYRRAADLRKAVASHLQAHGAQKWRLVQQQFPEISERTFWREVRGVRDALATVVDLEPIENRPTSLVPAPFEQAAELSVHVRMEAPEWTGRSVEIQKSLSDRLLAVLAHCQFGDYDVERFLECPPHTNLLYYLRRGEQPFIDVFRVQRLAFLKVQPNIRINMDWMFSGKGDPLIAVTGATEKRVEEAKERSAQIRAKLAETVMPLPPAALKSYYSQTDERTDKEVMTVVDAEVGAAGS